MDGVTWYACGMQQCMWMHVVAALCAVTSGGSKISIDWTRNLNCHEDGSLWHQSSSFPAPTGIRAGISLMQRHRGTAGKEACVQLRLCRAQISPCQRQAVHPASAAASDLAQAPCGSGLLEQVMPTGPPGMGPS